MSDAALDARRRRHVWVPTERGIQQTPAVCERPPHLLSVRLAQIEQMPEEARQYWLSERSTNAEDGTLLRTRPFLVTFGYTLQTVDRSIEFREASA